MSTALQKNEDIKFTYQDYLLLPEDKRYELIQGDLHRTPAPVTVHQRVSFNLTLLLGEHVVHRGLGYLFQAPTDVVLSGKDVVQPDILFISLERKSIIKPENIRGAPDLAIEILSPTTADRDRAIKKKLYAKYGVREYWIVDPDQQSIEVMTWSDKGYQTLQVYPKGSSLRSPLLPDLQLDLNRVFTF